VIAEISTPTAEPAADSKTAPEQVANSSDTVIEPVHYYYLAALLILLLAGLYQGTRLPALTKEETHV
jgi:hypothetical protein